jgi:hypothetical protein
MNIDTLSPSYVGEDKIVLTLDASTSNPRAFTPVQIDVDYSACAPAGVELPLELIIQGPTPASYREKTYRKFVPKSISFQPIASGEYLVLLREVAHNRWIGKLRIQVTGDPFEKV